MKKHNGYMIPPRERKVPKKLVCNRCRKELLPETAYFYVDESNFAITRNAPPYCRECYRAVYGK